MDGLNATRYGAWANDPVLWLLPGSNTLKLAGSLRYVDREGTAHTVPAGFAFDGASIPQWAWSLVGSPLDRRFRRAAALHDFYGTSQGVSARAAHRLFYDGLRAAGVHVVKALAFWLAVTVHRPRW